ncbi:MAG: tetratricopeptide repeat protein [Pontiellaceae bacterium]|nr:tetratricopeptide repeat protein [Pontiellaceae bacterium]MBN2786620.1 tetratricopeptide repeat protein [Pontiellaceae bacterium]
MNPEKHRFIKRSSVLSGVVLWLFSVATVHAEETPRSAMRKGLRAYNAGDYTNAVTLLEKTVLEFPGTGNYNVGNAWYRMGEYEKASECYEEALRTTDLKLQANACFNRGNALLAQTTAMTEPEQIGQAIECAFQAMAMFEQALLLRSDDLQAKQNYEQAYDLRLTLEHNRAQRHFDAAEALLAEYKAKEAQANYRQARKEIEHILADVDPGYQESKQLLVKVNERLDMLDRAVDEAERDLSIAMKQIEAYQYALAAVRLTNDSDGRKYAFDIREDLKKQYEETTQKNQEVLDIIKNLSKLNIAE